MQWRHQQKPAPDFPGLFFIDRRDDAVQDGRLASSQGHGHGHGQGQAEDDQANTTGISDGNVEADTASGGAPE